MKTIIFLLLVVLFSCSQGEYNCYDCVQVKLTTYKRTWTCGIIDTVTISDTLFHKQRCDNEKYIKAFERNATWRCDNIVMKCNLIEK